MVTIWDVAKKAGVSISTVSRVMNNSANVDSDKAKRVLEAVKELGYQPNALARGLIQRRTQTIGVLIPDVSNFFFAEVFRGMEDVAHARGWNVMICNTDSNPERMLNYIGVLSEKRVDGIIFTSEPVSEEYYEALKQLKVPVVLVATESRYPFPSVKINDETASYDATSLLIKKGHREIGMIAGPLNDPIAGVPRVRGFQRALKDADIPFRPERIVHGNFRFESGKEKAAWLLEQDPDITALFAASDEMAIGVYAYASEKGIRIPDQLSVIGFDNVRISRMVSPPLTTVAQPLYKMGETAASMLLDRITTNSEEPMSNGVTFVDHELIIRDSVRSL